jgi:cytochrome P450
MKWERFVPLARYTESWRQKRKLLDRGLRARAIAAYHPVQQTKTRILLNNLLEYPDEWEAHLVQLVTFHLC